MTLRCCTVGVLSYKVNFIIHPMEEESVQAESIKMPESAEILDIWTWQGKKVPTFPLKLMERRK